MSIGFGVAQTGAVVDYDRLKHVAADALGQAKTGGPQLLRRPAGLKHRQVWESRSSGRSTTKVGGPERVVGPGFGVWWQRYLGGSGVVHERVVTAQVVDLGESLLEVQGHIRVPVEQRHGNVWQGLVEVIDHTSIRAFAERG